MSERLLTDEEIKQAIQSVYEYIPIIEHDIEAGGKLELMAVAKAQDKATLKAVGKWLDRLPNITPNEIEAFKRGEMPKGG